MDMLRRRNGWVVPLLLITALLMLVPVQAVLAVPPGLPNAQAPTPEKPTPEKDEGGGGSPTATPLPSPYTEYNKKLDSSGGSLDLWLVDGHCVLIQVAPGALNQEIAFQINTVEPSKAPEDNCGQCEDPLEKTLCKATVAYTLKAWLAAGGEIPPSQTVAPYQHVICYTAADLALADNDPNNFVIAFFDEGNQEWVGLPTTVDAANQRVMATADHLSWWALMVSRPCQSPEEAIAERLPVTGNNLSVSQVWARVVDIFLK